MGQIPERRRRRRRRRRRSLHIGKFRQGVVDF